MQEHMFFLMDASSDVSCSKIRTAFYKGDDCCMMKLMKGRSALLIFVGGRSVMEYVNKGRGGCDSSHGSISS